MVVLLVNPVPTLHDNRHDLLRAAVLTKPGVSHDVITQTEGMFSEDSIEVQKVVWLVVCILLLWADSRLMLCFLRYRSDEDDPSGSKYPRLEDDSLQDKERFAR